MKHALCLLLLAAATAANAQTIYRCHKGGSTEYSQTPCTHGSVVDAADDRSAQQRAEGLRVAALDRQLATQMEHDRLARQAALRPAGAATLSPKPALTNVVEVAPRHYRKARIVRVKATGRR
jgi:hypothetical protein